MEAFVNIVILSQILFIMHSVVFLGDCPIVFHHIDGLEVLPDRGTWTTLSRKTANRWLWRWRRSRIWGNLPKITLKYFTITENISVYVTISLMREKQKKMMHFYKRFNKKNLCVRFNTNTGWKKLGKCKRMLQNHILLVTVISFFGRKVSIKRVLSWLICYTTITHNGAKKKNDSRNKSWSSKDFIL